MIAEISKEFTQYLYRHQATMKKIYLRLMDKEELVISEDDLLKNVKEQVEAILDITWLQEPRFHQKGGYVIVGEVSDNIDWEERLLNLRKCGFLPVI